MFLVTREQRASRGCWRFCERRVGWLVGGRVKSSVCLRCCLSCRLRIQKCHSLTVSICLFLPAVLRSLCPVRQLCDWEHKHLWLLCHLGCSFYERELSRFISGDILCSGTFSVWQHGFRGLLLPSISVLAFPRFASASRVSLSSGFSQEPPAVPSDPSASLCLFLVCSNSLVSYRQDPI